MNTQAVPSWVPEVAFNAGQAKPLFTIGSFSFQLYSLMIMLGILCSILSIVFFWNREKYKTEILMTFIIITIPTSIIGARLGYVVEELIYSDNPFAGSAWWKIWEGGLSIQGGVLVAAFFDIIYAYSQRNEIDFRKVISFIIPTILIGQFVGRWGNYANHEVYGKIDWSGNSVLVFGQSFASNMYISDAYTTSLGLEGAYRYPLFLYEGIGNLVAYLIIVWVFNLFGIFRPGTTSGMYFTWYGLLRLAMEPLRQESYSLYSNVAIGFIILGLLIIVYFEFFSRVNYIKTWRKYYFHYEYQNPAKYEKWVNKTQISNVFSSVFAKFKRN
ncbi:prolipoprotein diacylglyceryl transferase [Mycoplasmopsis gallinacea]|uniref:Phosphatidylglycerol--prolipoprotein diacylglyceryl transferase n=1 Tax=Mycoplasmopsis gallinacea TaxID=29556 RepID=A0A6H0V1B5_9BACT|nr:prolipoprotein diacylglyceryl transferase [Mycoplasmopsis gallinacea]QIW61992.1 prolipoprotein diacylglyceryl transferase [Mycoplasmopsis gallinacea]